MGIILTGMPQPIQQDLLNKIDPGQHFSFTKYNSLLEPQEYAGTGMNWVYLGLMFQLYCLSNIGLTSQCLMIFPPLPMGIWPPLYPDLCRSRTNPGH
jgi:hypothetical protein